MARIQEGGGGGGAGATTIPFTSEAFVEVFHGLGRRPVVEILVEASGGLFGFGGFGGGGFGASTLFEPMPSANYKILHLSVN